jgi:DNA adenine methylase
VPEAILRSPFRYPGGKSWMLRELRLWLESIKSSRALLIEPFAGGASASLYAVSEGLVDGALLVELDPDIAIVWKMILSDSAPSLCELIQEFQMTSESLDAAISRAGSSDLERAFAVLLRNRTNHGGIIARGAGRLRKGEAGKGLLSRWYPSTLVARIKTIHSLRHQLSVVCDDGLTVMKNRAAEQVLWFIDPPYIGTAKGAGKRLYNFNAVSIEELFQSCAALEGDFLLTHEDDPVIRSTSTSLNLQVDTIQMRSRHHVEMKELLISRNLCWLSTRHRRHANSKW